MRRTRNLPVLFLFCAALGVVSACAALPESSDDRGWLAAKGLTTAPDGTFAHCRGYGCRIVDRIHFTAQDWAEIESAFLPAPRDAAAERAAIAQAIGAFERRAGAVAGTTGDIAGTFGRVGDFQQDCIDESTNTTVFLGLLEDRGLLKFHDVLTPAGRFPVLAGSFWPHHTAAVADRGTGQSFAVDSWFEDGGKPAHVVPLAEWSAGWKPWSE